MREFHELPAIIYKIFVGAVSLVGFIIALTSWGEVAWRSFTTWVLVVATIYYMVAGVLALVAMIKDQKIKNCQSGRVWEGAVIIALLTCGVAAMVNHASNTEALQLDGFAAAVFYVTLPILALGDWWVFQPKGKFRTVDPIIWLAPAVIYFSWIMLTAELDEKMEWRYPQAWMDYQSEDFWLILQISATYLILMLAAGSLLVAADHFLAKKSSDYNLNEEN